MRTTNQVRDHVINIKLSKDEATALRQLAANELLTMSDFIRRRCLLQAMRTGRAMSEPVL
jgi:uncharacterized protein (DUF1778 family)